MGGVVEDLVIFFATFWKLQTRMYSCPDPQMSTENKEKKMKISLWNVETIYVNKHGTIK